MTKIGLLGAGRIGQVHARAVSSVPNAQLVAVADPMPAAAEMVRDSYGCEVRTIEQIKDAADIDAVIICTPTDTHADLIEDFARAGKAIFCEKPVDLDLSRVKACLKVVEETKATLMVGFQRRFDPDFQALRAEIDAGNIGEVEMVTLISRDPGAPPYDYIERSCGIFRDMMIHDFDVARWILGEEVETVQAAGSVLTDPEIGNRGDFDSANAILRTASGKQCTISNSRRATFGYDQRIEVHGSGGYGMLIGPAASKKEIAAFRRKLKARPGNYIAQPTLSLSTVPIFAKQGLSPRHVDLRPFVLVSPGEIKVTAGGLTRVALKKGSLVVNSSQGGGTKDTWIVED